ncbi:hydantoinase B/oxoprolinase family protein [Noviherbaspirillum sp. L7-7A]|uniref:hydantoinase B/oxoprolinase family protein n=1 Tax=Noviherbaspirillum sp. L7-7A TaxID=2850560 RepID=UPI001C2B7BE0|nr:hydantoinase B/oxoprolinase family protein [Noviherbaspirillum sp. L7-7A]MBV0881761.1 hydantoinase B/oxoprolinase family protein [Noviherbaspirillum sp. L7-7A]
MSEKYRGRKNPDNILKRTDVPGVWRAGRHGVVARVEMHPEDVFVIETPGSGGFGKAN